MVCLDTGVPVMAPVVLLKVRPMGRSGLISQLDTVPPPTLGVLAVIATPCVSVMFSVA